MVILHISKERYETVDDSREPTARCGGDGPVLKYGHGEGLVPYAALHPEFHCYECIKSVRQEVYK